MTLTFQHPGTLEQRRDVLDDIAHRWDNMPAGVRDRMLHTVTTLRGEPLRQAMEDLRDAIFTADALEPPAEMGWQDYEPALAGVICDPQHQAWLLACGQVAAVMGELLSDPVVEP